MGFFFSIYHHRERKAVAEEVGHPAAVAEGSASRRQQLEAAPQGLKAAEVAGSLGKSTTVRLIGQAGKLSSTGDL